VLYAYHRLGLNPGDPLETVNKRRRDLVKRHHPDRFVEPGQRARAERITAEINASHDLIERHLLK
jgi:curved DNA-binding protein CbpA